MNRTMRGGTLPGGALLAPGRHLCVPLPAVLPGVLLAVLPVVLVVVLAFGRSMRVAALPVAEVQAWQGEAFLAVTDAETRSSSVPSAGRDVSAGGQRCKGEGAVGDAAATSRSQASNRKEAGSDAVETNGTQSLKGKEATGDADVTGSGLASSGNSAGSVVPETPSVFEAEDGPIYYPGAGTTDAAAGTSTKPSVWEPDPTREDRTNKDETEPEPVGGVLGPGLEPKPVEPSGAQERTQTTGETDGIPNSPEAGQATGTNTMEGDV